MATEPSVPQDENRLFEKFPYSKVVAESAPLYLLMLVEELEGVEIGTLGNGLDEYYLKAMRDSAARIQRRFMTGHYHAPTKLVDTAEFQHLKFIVADYLERAMTPQRRVVDTLGYSNPSAEVMREMAVEVIRELIARLDAPKERTRATDSNDNPSTLIIQQLQGATYTDYCDLGAAPDESVLAWLRQHGVYRWRVVARKTVVTDTLIEDSEGGAS